MVVFAFCMLHSQAQIWKRLDKFIYPFPPWKICCVIFFSSGDILSEKNLYSLESIFFAKQELITCTKLVYNTLQLERISILSLYQCSVSGLLFSPERLFYNSNRKLFSCVWITWYNTWWVGRILNSYSSNGSITVPNFPNPSCKHGKRFLLLK